MGWPDLARLAARVGFGGVDWSLGPARTAGLEATKALFAELKIKPSIVNLPMARPLPFGGEQAAVDQSLVQLADEAAFTAAIGCDRMMLVLSPRAWRYDNGEDRAVRLDGGGSPARK